MPSEVESPVPSPAPAAKKPRGRPPKAALPEAHQQKIERLQAELEQAREAKRLADERQAGIVGRVVISHALADPDYRRQLVTLLRKEVTGKAELAAINELLS